MSALTDQYRQTVAMLQALEDPPERIVMELDDLVALLDETLRAVSAFEVLRSLLLDEEAITNPPATHVRCGVCGTDIPATVWAPI